jgi:hypothetical protein
MSWFDEVSRMDVQTLSKLMKMGAQVGKLLEFTGRRGKRPADDAGRDNRDNGTEG